MAPIGKFSGISKNNFDKVSDILATTVDSIDDIDLVLGGEFVQYIAQYDFTGEAGFQGYAGSGNNFTASWNPGDAHPGNIPAFSTFKTGSVKAAGFNFWAGAEIPITGASAWGNVPLGGSVFGHPTLSPNAKTAGWVLQQRRVSNVFNNNQGGVPFYRGATSSPSTGPGGGLGAFGLGYQPHRSTIGSSDIANQDANGLISSLPFLYTETSNQTAGNRVFLTQLRFSNLHTPGTGIGSGSLMSNSNNDVFLKFWYHAHGVESHFGSLLIYAASSPYKAQGPGEPFNDALNPNIYFALNTHNALTVTNVGYDATIHGLLKEIENDELTAPFPPNTGSIVNETTNRFDGTAFDRDYVEVSVNLNALRDAEINNGHMFHTLAFVHAGHSSFKADLAIDNVSIQELTPTT